MNRNDLHRLRAVKLIEQHWKDLCDVDHGAWSEQWGEGSELTKLYLAWKYVCAEEVRPVSLTKGVSSCCITGKCEI